LPSIVAALIPSPSPLVVFAQRPDARLDVDAWNAHGERFFAVRIGLAQDPRAPAERVPTVCDETPLVIAPQGFAPGIRTAAARPASDDDRASARAAEARASAGSGLALLAARCPTVWLVERTAERDALAWSLAVVLSSALLGPILDPDDKRLVGVKSARAILDSFRL
jgi:hypothetical protein